MTKCLLRSILVLFSFATSAYAFDIMPTGGASYDFGGDDLLKVKFTDGTSSTLRAGDGMQLNFGAVASLDQSNTFFATMTLGWKYSGIGKAENGSATISRFPLEGMFYYRAGKHRIGAGMTKHLGISYDTGGVLADASTNLESKIGTILTYGYSSEETDRMSFGVKYTNLTYTATEFDTDVDAGSWGVFILGGF